MKLNLNKDVLFLTGEVNFQNASAILKQFKHLTFKHETIKLDCSGITNASSVALAVLIEMLKLLKIKNINASIIGLSKSLKALAQVSQLSDLIA